MSDDDEVHYVKKTRTIVYGSLEDSERARLAAEAAGEGSNDAEETTATTQAANPQINISNGTSLHENRNRVFENSFICRIHGARGCYVERQTGIARGI